MPRVRGCGTPCRARWSEDLRARKEARRGGEKGSAKPPMRNCVNGLSRKAVFAENSRPESSERSRIGQKRKRKYCCRGQKKRPSPYSVSNRHRPRRGRRRRPKQVQGCQPCRKGSGVRGAHRTQSTRTSDSCCYRKKQQILSTSDGNRAFWKNATLEKAPSTAYNAVGDEKDVPRKKEV